MQDFKVGDIVIFHMPNRPPVVGRLSKNRYGTNNWFIPFIPHGWADMPPEWPIMYQKELYTLANDLTELERLYYGV